MAPSRTIPIAAALESHTVPVCPTCKMTPPDLDSGDRFCSSCGDRIHTATIRVVRCSCDPTRALGPEVNYCPECGTAVSTLVHRYLEAKALEERAGVPALLGAPR